MYGFKDISTIGVVRCFVLTMRNLLNLLQWSLILDNIRFEACWRTPPYHLVHGPVD